MLPAEGENEGKEGLDCVTQNCLRLRDKNDLFLQEDGLEDADDGLEG